VKVIFSKGVAAFAYGEACGESWSVTNNTYAGSQPDARMAHCAR
jgi:hypothetical protein